MGTYFFHEDTTPNATEGTRDIVRYYYEDISEEIMTRSFRFFPKPVRTEFLGNGLIPLADLRVDVKAKLWDFLRRRNRPEQRQVS